MFGHAAIVPHEKLVLARQTGNGYASEMRIPRQPYSGSWLQFPRFEKTVADGASVFIAQERPWVRPAIAEILKKPVTALGRRQIDMKAQNNWIGIDHTACEKITQGIRIRPEVDIPGMHKSPDGKLLYRIKLLIHSFLWDSQAISGTRWEAVLEQGSVDEPKFEEVAALLIRPPHPITGKERGQMFVIKDGEKWKEPSASPMLDSPEAAKREFFLETLGELALYQQSPAEILPVVDNRGDNL